MAAADEGTPMGLAARATVTIAVLCSISCAAAAPVDKSFGERGVGPDPDPLLFVITDEGVLVNNDRPIDFGGSGDDARGKFRDAERNVAAREAAYKAGATPKNAALLIDALLKFAGENHERDQKRKFVALISRVDALCKRHGLACKERMYEREGNAHLLLGNGAAAFAAYARASDGSVAPEEKAYSPWDKLISRFLAARLAGRGPDAVRYLTDAETEAKKNAAQPPKPAGRLSLAEQGHFDGYTDVAWPRRHAWTLNWRGDERLAGGDKDGAAKDYDEALQILRAYDASQGNVETVVDEAANGPKALRAIDDLKDPDAYSAAFSKIGGNSLLIMAPRRYAEKVRAARDIALTLRRVARVEPSRATAIGAQVAAIQADLLKRDPGPGVSSFSMYNVTFKGDALRSLGDASGALHFYKATYERFEAVSHPEAPIVDFYNERALAMLEARIGLILLETGKKPEALRYFRMARQKFEADYADRPSRSAGVNLAWIEGLIAGAN